MRPLALLSAEKVNAGHSDKRRFVEIVHDNVPGRTRFSIRGLHRSPAFGAKILQYSLQEKDLQVISVSTKTGTLLMQHAVHQSAESLRRELDQMIGRLFMITVVSNESTVKESCFKQLQNMSDSWFLKSPEDIAGDLEVTLESGLDDEEAQKRFDSWGPNAQPHAAAKSPWTCLQDQYRNLPSGLLAASALMSLMTGARLDAFLITGVLIANGAIGFFTERRTDQLIGSLGTMRKGLVPTIRSGHLAMIPTNELVPGDIVILEPGPVPADIRIASAQHLYADESALTGENTPAPKNAENLGDPTTPLAERSNLLFAGTVVLSGHGRGIVIATGRFTEIGVIQQLVSSLSPPPTPMQQNLERVGNQLVNISVSACAGLFLLGLARGLSGIDLLKTVISLAIAAVPEGLPTVGTTTLALGIANMQKKSVFVRHLSAVENLGCVSVICFDKTGTLTLNQMTVTHVITPTAQYAIEDGTILRDGTPLATKNQHLDRFDLPIDDLRHLAKVSVLCNDAELKNDIGEPGGALSQEKTPNLSLANSRDMPSTYGSPTEKALLRFGLNLGCDAASWRDAYPRIRTIYRSEAARYMSTWHRTKAEKTFVAMKGSPEDVLSLCATYLEDGILRPMTASSRATFLAENQRLADQALRVLALAKKEIPHHESNAVNSTTEMDSHTAPQDLIWLGLVGLKDPPRAGVGPLLEAFHTAGIRTNMVTGDQESTAQAIGRDLGMNGDGSSARLPIFSRVSPSDKLKIIQSLQDRGAVVAMTGDGVNDSPALRAADVGIAMGGGAGAAIEAAEVVLGESNLETMLEAVRLGRTIRDNLGKAIHFLIATNLSELIVTFCGVIFGKSHVLSAKQLLWINLLTDVFPAIGIAFEPSEPDIMNQPPLGRTAELFDREEWGVIGREAIIMSLGSVSSYGLGWKLHKSENEASTMAFSSLAISQLLHAISARHKHLTIFTPTSENHLEPNPWVNKAVNGGLLAQCATIMVPQIRSLMGNARLDLESWVISLICGCFPFLVTQSLQSITDETVVYSDLSLRRNGYVF
jgi:Ca2+-transporting ATPase